MAPPTSADLIETALNAGQIDYPTSLIYRTWAWIGDGRLPDQFIGAAGPDDSSLDEAAYLARTSPESVPPDLTALMLRPTDPASAFFASPSDAVAGAFEQAAFTRGEGPGWSPENQPNETPCGANGWATAPDFLSPEPRFRVWAACTGLAARDYREKMLVTLNYLDEVFDLETPLKEMGEAKSDQVAGGDPAAYGGDGAIDFYLVNAGQPCIRPQCAVLTDREDNKTLGQTEVTDPFESDGSASSYVLIRRSQVPLTVAGDDSSCAYRDTLAHELFHVLQSSHNWDYLPHPFWFHEASADWAETHYERACAPASDAYLQDFPLFQRTTDFPLTSTALGRQYGAFVWPYFIELNKGAHSVTDIWWSLGAVTNEQAARDVIDEALPFKDYFREFAIADLDQRFKPGNVSAPDYWTKPGDSQFPEYTPPSYYNSVQDQVLRPLAAGKPMVFEQNAAFRPLVARYYQFKVDDESAAGKVGQIVFDFSKLDGLDRDLDIDFVLGIRDSTEPSGLRWERRKAEDRNAVNLMSPPHEYRICRTLKSDLVDHIYLVLSNHNKDPNAAPLTGSFSVQPLAEPCLFGDLSLRNKYTESGTSNPATEEDDYTLDMHVDMRFQNGQWVTTGGSWDLIGNGNKTISCPGSPGGQVQASYTWQGRGTWLPPGGSASLALGEGVFGFGIVNHVPLVTGIVMVNASWSNFCVSDPSGPVIISFSWSGDPHPCSLDRLGNVPCDETVTAPPPLGPDDAGPYDLTGSEKSLDHGLSATTTTEETVVGVIGGTP